MDNTNQQVPPVPSQTPDKIANNLSFAKTLAYGFAIASIGVTIAIGGYLLGANKTKPQPVVQTSVTPFVSPTPDPTASWQTYTNVQYGFQMKYPNDWAVKDNLLQKPASVNSNLEISNSSLQENPRFTLFINPAGFGLPIPDKVYELSPIGNGKLEILNKQEIAPTKEGMSNVDGHMIINSKSFNIGSNSYIFIFNFVQKGKDYEPIFNQILSTFKFTDKNLIDETASWGTYTHTQLGIEFKYPPNLSLNAIGNKDIIPVSFTDLSNTKQRLSTSHDINFKVIPVAPGADYKTTLINDIVFVGSGMHPKSFAEFSSKTIGDNMVYYIRTGLLEGVLSMNYYIVNKNQVFAFVLTSSPVDWTNPNFKPENDPLNQKLLQILSTFKFTN